MNNNNNSTGLLQQLYVVRSHYSYESESSSGVEAVFLDPIKAYRDAIGRVLCDDEIRFMTSKLLCMRMNLPIKTDLQEDADRQDVLDCLKTITELSELKIIFQELDSGDDVSTRYFIDTTDLIV